MAARASMLFAIPEREFVEEYGGVPYNAPHNGSVESIGDEMAISDNVVLGDGIQIFHPDLVNLYGCTIGAESKIGTFVEIQKGV